MMMRLMAGRGSNAQPTLTALEIASKSCGSIVLGLKGFNRACSRPQHELPPQLALPKAPQASL
jgi:hypothetical protein